MKETRACAWCGKSVTRMPSRFEAPPERTFCGTLCRNRWIQKVINPGLAHRFAGQVYERPNLPHGEQHHHWGGDAVPPEAGRQRARRRYALGPCERCGKPATDRHHKDGVTTHNEPENIAILCRRCHMEVDGRLAAFVAMAKRPKRKLQGVSNGAA